MVYSFTLCVYVLGLFPNEGSTIDPLSHVVTCRSERKRCTPDTRYGISVPVHAVLQKQALGLITAGCDFHLPAYDTA